MRTWVTIIVSHRQDRHVHSQCVCVCVCTYRVIVEGVTLSVTFAVLVGSIHCTLSNILCVAWGIVQPFTSFGTPAIHKQWYRGEYLQTLAKLWYGEGVCRPLQSYDTGRVFADPCKVYSCRIHTYSSHVAVLAPRTSNVCHGFSPRGPPASLSHMILLGVSKYVSDRARYFSLTSIALDLEARWR